MMVMAAGHLGGNLAWLSISGEDAPDLVATAPISAQRIISAKVEAVMGAIAFIFALLVAALALAGSGGGRGYIGHRRLGDLHSALLSDAGAAEPVSRALLRESSAQQGITADSSDSRTSPIGSKRIDGITRESRSPSRYALLT